MNLDRLLKSPRDAEGRWLLDFDLYLWAKGVDGYPHLAALTFPA